MNSGSLMMLQYPEAITCCQCQGDIKMKLACGFTKDNKPVFACSPKCRTAFFAKAQNEKSDPHAQRPIKEEPNTRAGFREEMYKKLCERQKANILANFGDEEELPKGIKITDTYNEKLITWKPPPNNRKHEIFNPETNKSTYEHLHTQFEEEID